MYETFDTGTKTKTAWQTCSEDISKVSKEYIMHTNNQVLYFLRQNLETFDILHASLPLNF